jgi:hypothetical protein
MKKEFIYLLTCITAIMLCSCLTVKQKEILQPAPYLPGENGGEEAPKAEESLNVYYSVDHFPVIDGQFTEWKGMKGVHASTLVYGGSYDSANTSGYFVARCDENYYYVYANITDDDARESKLPAPQAWRADSIELFLGTSTLPHTSYKDSDNRVRVVSHSKNDMFDNDASINDESDTTGKIKSAVVFNDTGYEVEVAIPFELLNIDPLTVGQSIIADFQINDADNGSERSRMYHWTCPLDNAYKNPSCWGKGKVVVLDKAEENK